MRLLDAGLQLFGTVGYAATTIEALCAEASLNARYFYEQFRHREELLGAVHARLAANVFDEVRAALATATDPASRLEASLRGFVGAVLADERGARIIYIEVIGVSAALEEQRRTMRRDYIEVLAQEAGRLPGLGTRPAEERRAIAVALIGATDGLVVDWIASDRQRPWPGIVDTLITVFGPVFT